MSVWLPPKTVEISCGEFVCPHCHISVAYKHKERVRRRLFFFIIPILGDKIEEYVECQGCRHRFPIGVLRGELSAGAKQILDSLLEKLQSGTSIEEPNRCC